MNAAAARIAREAADAREAREPDRPRFVAGAIGPTNRTASISPDVNDPAARNVTLEELAAAYQEAAEGLIEGGADILLIETIFDTLNGKAAIFGVEAAQDGGGHRPAADRLGHDRRCVGADAERPDRRGVLDLDRPRPADDRRAQLRARRRGAAAARRGSRARSPRCPSRSTRTPACRTSSAATTTRRSRWPTSSAGSPATGSSTSSAAAAGRRRPTSGRSPRRSRACRRASSPEIEPKTRLSGLEPLAIPQPGNVFVNVGERTNVTGSRKFAKLILEDRFEEAVEVARQQVEAGAQIIDVNMDEAMLDSAAAMTRFLNLLAAEPDIAPSRS